MIYLVKCSTIKYDIGNQVSLNAHVTKNIGDLDFETIVAGIRVQL